MSRYTDDIIRVSGITEIIGMASGLVGLQDVFVFREEGIDRFRRVVGQFIPTGLVPAYVEKLEREGIHVPLKIFEPKVS